LKYSVGTFNEGRDDEYAGTTGLLRDESMRVALEDEYDVQFELFTTGRLTPAAESDFNAYKQEMADCGARLLIGNHSRP